MVDAAVRERVEKLAETLVFCDPEDLQGLARVHSELGELTTWAEGQGLGRIAAACGAASDGVERIILGEAQEPEGILAALNETIGALQQYADGGRQEQELMFPALFMGEAGGPSDTEGDASGKYTLVLPPYVDETIFGDFLARQDGVLEEMEELILALEADRNESNLGAFKRLVHTLKGEAALLGLTDVEKLCHAAEDGLVSDDRDLATDDLLSLKDWLKRTFDACAGNGPAPESPASLLAGLRGEAPPEEEVSRATATCDAMPAEELPEPDVEDDLQFVPKPLTGDQELLGDFVLEATEHLDNADVQLLTLETTPTDEDAINAVFRAFHTIKGVAGFLGVEEIQALSHEAENLLDLSRKGGIRLEGQAIDLVFDAVDMLKRCIDAINNALGTGEDLVPQDGLSKVVRAIRGILAAPQAAVPAPVADAAAQEKKPSPRLGDILVQSELTTQSAVEEAALKQQEPAKPKRIGEVLSEDCVTTTRRVNEALEIQKDMPDKRVGDILVEMGAASEDDVEHAATQQQAPAKAPRIGETLVREGEVEARDVAQALRAQRQPGAKPGGIRVREAVKVDADRLDQLVDMIGELVISESMVAQAPEIRDDRSTDLARHISLLDKITRELQVTAMSLRMVPVRSTFQKMARLVRDLSKKTGKAVEFSMTGEDTELDKTVVDKLGDPLVHMVRNSVDHGLEASAEERRQAGKPAMGHVELRAFHEGGNIHIEVEDDGRGLNREAILKKAISRGIIGENDRLSDREVWNLIFEAGFSTAQQVTEVSGRGVGMDVVKRNIEALRGKTEIQSTAGKGSIFSIQLPLTLAIIDGMVVRVGSERYILPTLSIVLSLQPSENNINTVVGQGEMLSIQGRLLPLFRLYQTLKIEDAVTDPLQGTVVVVEHDGKQAGLLVDEILGQQQIVIKSLGESLRGVPGISGGAIMPDGCVGLILDIGGLVRLAGQAVAGQ